MSMSREARVAYAEVEKGVKHVARSVGEVQVALRRAERKIEADARARIRDLRRDARTQLALLRARRRDAARTLVRLSGAAGGAWRDVKKAADRTLTEARTVASSAIKRFQRAIGE